MNQTNDRWSGRIGFILATIGSAVGLGSIWKFPYEVGSNGGSAFLLFYLLGLVIIVTPLMLAEFAVGRRGAADAEHSIATVAKSLGAASAWRYVGLLGVVTGVLVLSFYSVIGGWTIAYALETALEGLAGSDVSAVEGRYRALMASPARLIACHAVFLIISAVVVARGIGGGIEAAAKVLMPILVILMLALTAYSVIEGDAAATFKFLFSLDTQHLNARTALDALGLGFFSIGVGFCLMITYAAYAGRELNLRQAAIASIVADTAISFLAGFAVFPIVFAHGMDPASGPGLVFVTLPLAFADMPFGTYAAISFYVLLLVAALGSAISLLELAVALATRRLAWSRPAATWLAASVCFVLGLMTVFSFNHWADWFPLAALEEFRNATMFDLIDYATSNVMLPTCGFFTSLFVGWALPVQLLIDELGLSMRAAHLLRFVLRYIVPGAIAVATLAPLFQ